MLTCCKLPKICNFFACVSHSIDIHLVKGSLLLKLHCRKNVSYALQLSVPEYSWKCHSFFNFLIGFHSSSGQTYHSVSKIRSSPAWNSKNALLWEERSFNLGLHGTLMKSVGGTILTGNRKVAFLQSIYGSVTLNLQTSAPWWQLCKKSNTYLFWKLVNFLSSEMEFAHLLVLWSWTEIVMMALKQMFIDYRCLCPWRVLRFVSRSFKGIRILTNGLMPILVPSSVMSLWAAGS